jgi:hypothetical protein
MYHHSESVNFVPISFCSHRDTTFQSPGCLHRRLADVTRFQVETGMYWFFAAVFLSLVTAHWTEKMLRQHN